jgi:CarD family transcriptional regulator
VTFQLGDKVIYPNHGLGIVERIEEKTILGTTCGFFHLRIVANDTTVLVPVANVDGVGLRKAIDDAEVERLFSLIGDGKIDNHQNWKGRFKDNSDKMRTGSIYDMADVLKSLTFLSKSKSLSFREKRMLDRAKALIISEVSEVMRLKALEVEEQVDRALEKCFTTKVRNINRTQARAKVAAKPAVPAKPAVAAAPAAKPVATAAAKPAAVNGAMNGSANGNGKPAVATKPPVVAKTVVTAKMKAAAVPPLVGRRTAARAS